MKLTIRSMLEIREPTKEFVYWCKQNLELANPEYTKKLRMGLWVRNTPQKIRLYEVHGDTIKIPYGCLYQIEKLFSFEWVDHLQPKENNLPWTYVDLRDYQSMAKYAMLSKHCGILVAPAGSGKTRTALAMIGANMLKTLWITHTKDLLNQSLAAASEFFPKNCLGTITEGKINVGTYITFATVQTLANIDLQSFKDEWDMIICDECHRVACSGQSVTMYSKVLNNLEATYKYGLTATPFRADGLIKSTFALLGDIDYEITKQAVADKIVPLKIYPLFTKITPTGYLKYDGTIDYNKLVGALCSNQERNQIIVDTIEHSYLTPTLVLSSRVGHIKELQNMLSDKAKMRSALISGDMTSKTEKELRERYIEEMRKGERTILFATFNLAKEGLDIPRLERVILTTPQKDYSIITQSVGRVARSYPDKEYGIVIDLVDSESYCYKAFKKRSSIYRKHGYDICSG